MRLFQHEWDDLTVSVVAAENKEEACELLKEFGDDIDPELVIPLRNFMITLAPSVKQGEVCWGVDNIGINTILELPLLEPLPKKDDKDCKVIELCDFLRGE